MNAREITIANIKEYGLWVGESKPGKGVELIKPNAFLGYFGYLDDKTEVEKMILSEKLKGFAHDSTFVDSASMMDGRRFDFKGNMNTSQRVFSSQMMLDPWANGIKSMSLYREMGRVGYINVSAYKSDYDSQLDLVRELIRIDGKVLYEDEFSDWEDTDAGDAMSFSSYRNDDYQLHHGSDLSENTSEAYHIDGKIYNSNDSVMDDFWDFSMKGDYEYLDEINKAEKVTIYHRKNKDWYVARSIFSQDMCLDFRNENEDCQESLYFHTIFNDCETELSEVIAHVEGWKFDCEVRSLIKNQLKIGAMYGNEYGDEEFNLNILTEEYGEDNLDEVFYEILNLVDYKHSLDITVVSAYEAFLVGYLDDSKKLFGKHKHLNELEELASLDGKKVVYSRIAEFTKNESFAIAYKNEQYHFYLEELYRDGAKALYLRASGGLSERLNQVYSESILSTKAKLVFVGLNDSFAAGNCVSGTKSFCSRFGIDTSNIGGIRGDALLEIDYSHRTKGAVLHAIKRQSSSLMC